MKYSIFQDITLGVPLKVIWCFRVQQSFSCCLLQPGFLLGLIFNPEDSITIHTARKVLYYLIHRVPVQLSQQQINYTEHQWIKYLQKMFISTLCAYIQSSPSRMYTHTYIILHSIDPKLVKMTVRYGISHTATKIHIPYNWSFSNIHTQI
jgi:hypothetical protein